MTHTNENSPNERHGDKHRPLIQPDDPRITAYALGAMEPGERVAFEALLQHDASAQAEVEAVQGLGGDLESLFAAAPAVTLTTAQRETVAAAIAPVVHNTDRRAWLPRVIGLAAAAVVLCGVGVVVTGADQRASHASTTAARATSEQHSLADAFAATSRFVGWGPVSNPGGPVRERDMAQSEATRVGSGNAELRRAYDKVVKNLSVAQRSLDASLPPPGMPKGIQPGEAWSRVQVPPQFVTGGRSSTRKYVVDVPRAGGAGGGFLDLTSSGDITKGGLVDAAGVFAGGGGGHTWRVVPRGAGGSAYPSNTIALDPAIVRRPDGTYLVQPRTKPLAGWVPARPGFGAMQPPVPVPARPTFGAVQPPSRTPYPGERYQPLIDNTFQDTKDNHTSTFSIDVDTASYTNVRRMLLAQGVLPPRDAVRIEEFINAFDYGYATPGADAPHPIAMVGDVSGCPWNPDHRLARIALQAHDVGDKRPTLNLVFLVDVSGSMSSIEKLPLVKRGLSMLLEQMRAGDRIGIVTYASNASVLLTSRDASETDVIQRAIDSLAAGGSTNGEGGIQLAYAMARKHLVKGAANRVILATDGDFNVGVTDNNDLEALIAKEAAAGVDLSVLGFGMGNFKDERLERLSNRGNGNYAYIDGIHQARKALVTDMLGTLVTVAKDVKLQLFFNPQQVRSWRLIGYANRRLAAKDFNDDRKDAGDIGSGHCVTALYEIVPVGAPEPRKAIDPNPYVAPEKDESKEEQAPTRTVISDALFTLRLRYKPLEATESTLVETVVKDGGAAFDKSDADFQWATAVAGFGMILRESQDIGGFSLAAVEEIASAVAGENNADRAKFIEMVQRAKTLRRK